MHNYEYEKQQLERELKRINYRLKIVKDLIKKRKALINITPDYVIEQYIKSKNNAQDDRYTIQYNCYNCGMEWEEVYACACNSECGHCNTKNIEPISYKDNFKTD